MIEALPLSRNTLDAESQWARPQRYQVKSKGVKASLPRGPGNFSEGAAARDRKDKKASEGDTEYPVFGISSGVEPKNAKRSSKAWANYLTPPFYIKS